MARRTLCSKSSPVQDPMVLEVVDDNWFSGGRENNKISVEMNQNGVSKGSSSSIENTYESRIIQSLDKISTSFERLYNLLEKRERERQYTVWDAIKEIPNLDQVTRFTALDLIDTKTKKDAFLKMSPEERLNWIFYKMQGA
ncbi:hypothetical protein ABKV19_006609 [Rosa sericea]